MPVKSLTIAMALVVPGLMAPAQAANATVDASSVAASAYVRARAADVRGELQASAAGYAAALAMAPGEEDIALRAYRAAIAAGDKALALRALKTLDAAGKMPADGRVLILADAVTNRDWVTANVAANLLEKEVFSLVLPVVRAWIVYGSKQGDPLALLGPLPAVPDPSSLSENPKAAPTNVVPAQQTPTPYAPEHRAAMLLAMGKLDEGVALVRELQAAGLPVRIRLLAASALARKGRRDEALALVAGDEPAMAAARARIAAGQALLPPTYTAADGIADLLARMAADVNRQRVTPVSIALARIATFAAPANAITWLTASEVLNQAGRPQAALAALGNVRPDDVFADTVAALRLRLMVATDDKAGALATAQARVVQRQATTDDWLSLGDLYSELERHREAADAYTKALGLAEGQGRQGDDLWPILLLQGGALDRAGDWAGGKAALSRALALAPEQAVVLNYLGYAQLEKRENVTEARKMVERASALRPDDPSITDSLGWSYYLTGDLPRAIDALEKAAKGDPAQSTINEHLGDAYWRAGRRYEARYSWHAALIVAEEASAKRLREKIDTGLTTQTAAP
ncbi:tetratricopeptide repeat protein [Sphingomonas naphthae]|uniref:Tetratricopeptide repeat protein n=1 Tax=Sphingomonas naphthae TaxID=1813468 RepID=A0ABY7TNK2_9SPHN|nr:tetratricopeptide repeat protein [Sphingomonas naphthae]WCT74810.1 tetratricopeptide repeat protein [Sphingomonas naphthae]